MSLSPFYTKVFYTKVGGNTNPNQLLNVHHCATMIDRLLIFCLGGIPHDTPRPKGRRDHGVGKKTSRLYGGLFMYRVYQ